MTRIYATSDVHGMLPPVAMIPECDILLIGGDICPDIDLLGQLKWLDSIWRDWLTKVCQRASIVIGIAGNHDFIFETDAHAVEQLHLPWKYLQDTSITIDGVKIYGTPWVPNLPSWAFYGNKEKLSRYYGQIPKDTDIVLSHGPPYGLGDLSVRGNEHTGAKTINDMLGRVRPKAFVCGHIHEGFGHYRYRPQHGNAVDIYNVAWVDENYRMRPIADPIVQIIIDGQEESSDEQRKVRPPVTDTGSASKPVEGS